MPLEKRTDGRLWTQAQLSVLDNVPNIIVMDNVIPQKFISYQSRNYSTIISPVIASTQSAKSVK